MVGKFFVTDIWLDSRYELAWTTSMIVMVGTLFSSLMGSGHLILRAINKQTYFLVCEFVIFLANVVATYVLVKPLGIKGAAYSTTAAYVIGMCVLYSPRSQENDWLGCKKIFPKYCANCCFNGMYEHSIICYF